MNIKLALLLFIVGFVLVNGLKFMFVSFGYKKMLKKTAKNGIPDTDFYKSAFKPTIMFQPFYYVFVWLICSYIYISKHGSTNIFSDSLKTGILWVTLTILIEMVIWVIANHKMKLSWKEMYIYTQPWILLNYYAVFVSPLILSLMF